MNSARERAVEAARAAGLNNVEHTSRGTGGRRQIGFTGGDLDLFLDHVLRAAFPILAEDVVAWHDEQAAAERQSAIEASEANQPEDVVQHHLLTSARHATYALSLRARIQQMAEAE